MKNWDSYDSRVLEIKCSFDKIIVKENDGLYNDAIQKLQGRNNGMKNILIVDDNKQILDVLKEYAVREGFVVYTAESGTEALAEFESRSYEAVLLDVMMPEMDGFEVCRQIRKISMVPIIMITARGEDFERIMGLDIGADDYVVKPFSPSEVMARLRAILRRVDVSDTVQTEYLVRGNLRISIERFQAFIGEQEVHLTKKELEILWLLASQKGKVFSRGNILYSVWGYDYFGDERTVDTHIKRMRMKLDAYEHPGWEIVTVRGVGYKFEVCNE